MEAVCYWENYPQAGQAMQKKGLTLSKTNASIAWNMFANEGNYRSVICDKMKKGAPSHISTHTSEGGRGGKNDVPSTPGKGCTSNKDGSNIQCNWA